MVTRYQPTADGYQIMGSRELFNRALYGGHGHDQRSERYFVLAGDQPLVMGCLTDWRARQDCTHAKAGVLMIGVGHTPGLRVPQFCYTGRDEDDGDRASQWFHHCGDTIATYATTIPGFILFWGGSFGSGYAPALLGGASLMGGGLFCAGRAYTIEYAGIHVDFGKAEGEVIYMREQDNQPNQEMHPTN